MFHLLPLSLRCFFLSFKVKKDMKNVFKNGKYIIVWMYVLPNRLILKAFFDNSSLLAF